MKRKYDIGHGITIEDDGYTISAVCQPDPENKRGMMYIGVKRPRVGPPPKPGEQLEVKYSEGRKYFYLPGYADPHGFWLGTKAWPTQAECEAQQKPGLLGKTGVEFTKTSTGEKWYRERLDFAYWKVDSEKQSDKTAVDDMVIDFMHLASTADREGEVRFNEAIAFSGRDLDWIMERIGAWVPPVEVPVVSLK